jgi:LmbE family N-acetylglucosaminyl deacetylase
MEATRLDFTPCRALVITAHADDMDFYCSGLLAQWAISGAKIDLIVTTSGDKGSNLLDNQPNQLSRLREEEQLASAQVIGLGEVVFLHYPDSELSFVDKNDLRAEFTRQIRRFQPDIVLTHDPLVRLKRVHPDHRVVGEITRDACFPISEICNCYPEQITLEGLQCCQPEKLMFFDTDLPNCFLDISQVLDVKVQALQKHLSQEYVFQDGPETHLRRRAEKIGQKYGLAAAEEFLLIDLVEKH